jgi:hypothetical protein
MRGGITKMKFNYRNFILEKEKFREHIQDCLKQLKLIDEVYEAHLVESDKEGTEYIHIKKDEEVTQTKRSSPQLSCTILPEDKKMLNDLTIFAINKTENPINTSSIIRAIIRFANENKEEIEW